MENGEREQVALGAGVGERIQHAPTLPDVLLEESSVGFLFVDEDGRCRYLNRSATRITGYGLEQVANQSLHDLVHHTRSDGSSCAGEDCSFGRALAGERARGEVLLIHRNGSRRPVEYTVTALAREDLPTGTLVELRELVGFERVRGDSGTPADSRLQRMLEIETVGIVFWSAQGRLLTANNAFLKMAGTTLDEIVGASWRDFTPEEFVEESERAMWQLLHQGEMTPYEKRYYRRDGSTWWGLFAARRLDENEIVEFVLDISEQKEADEALRRLNADLERRVQNRTARLEQLNFELEAFNYSVSHDLRAPLRGIDGFSKALLEDYGDMLDQRGREYIGRVRAGATRMGSLIDDLLKLSRLSRGSLEEERVDLSALARDIAAELREKEPERSVALEVEDGMVAHGDSRLIRIALFNLMENAWKFTRPVAVQRIEVGSSRTAGEHVYWVRDNGIGFNTDYSDKLFVPFQRLHSAEAFEGAGIGLATTQRVIRRHGGDIWAKSDYEQGTAFYFTLPYN